MSDVISMGEMLIDFVSTESGVTLIEAPAFKKAPGGAPANVAVGLARLGVSCSFMGKVGDDDFGRFLALTLEENGVDITPLRFSEEARTALAFVSLQADGERNFMFYRHPSADMLFRPEEVDTNLIRAGRLFHFGSITLAHEPSRSATLHAVETAHQAGLLISYDPNLRLNLWSDAETAREGMRLGWSYAHIIKASGEELTFLAETEDTTEAVHRLWHDNLKLLAVTDGPLGSRYFTASHHGQVPGFVVDTIDTTGAGDGFMAGLLRWLLRNDKHFEDIGELENALRYANAVGALTTIRLGAIPALPTPEQVEQLLMAK